MTHRFRFSTSRDQRRNGQFRFLRNANKSKLVFEIKLGRPKNVFVLIVLVWHFSRRRVSIFERSVST